MDGAKSSRCKVKRTSSESPSRFWTSEEDAYLIANFKTMLHAAMGKVLDRSERAVRNRCSVLKLKKADYEWSIDELAMLREAYGSHKESGKVFLDDLAAKMGRGKTHICRKARALGLTISNRKYGGIQPRINKFTSQEELHDWRISRMREWLQQHGHPRGALGMKHTLATKRLIGHKAKQYLATLTSEERTAIALKGVQTKMMRYGTGHPGAFTGNPYSRAKRGKRADLGNCFFRSKWEANYARYLKFLQSQDLIEKWEYECHTFVFQGVTRGVLSYTPDFRITEKNGDVIWHEVKGWMDAKSKAKLKRMKEFYPGEKLLIIDQSSYKAISQYSRLIEGWED